MNGEFFADFDLLLDFDFLLDFVPLLCFNFRGKTFALDVVARFVTARTQTTSGNFMMMIWWKIKDVYRDWCVYHIKQGRRQRGIEEGRTRIQRSEYVGK